MGGILQQFLKPLIKPLTRLIVGVLAIPLFRMIMRRVVRMQVLDAELEKDLEQWFRGSLVLLVATRNMEMVLFGWLYSENTPSVGDFSPMGAFLMGLRLLLAISVIEMMPDQELFSIIHPGPPKIKYDKTKSLWTQIKEYSWPMTRGIVCQHLHRSSPVFAILCAIAPGRVGWFCYGMALAQYLFIGLVTSKDKALDALTEFDRQVAERRRELIEEFDYTEKDLEAKNRQNEKALKAKHQKQEVVNGPFSSALADEKLE
jgi:hypothetical protein